MPNNADIPNEPNENEEPNDAEFGLNLEADLESEELEPDGSIRSDELEQTLQSSFIPIPPIFHSLEKGAPFTSCLQCGRDLIESGELYLIEKVFKRVGTSVEPIIEMAMCVECGDNEGQRMSTDSAAAIQQYFEEKVDVGQRFVQLAMNGHDSDSADLWIDQCMVTGKSQSELQEFQVIALCTGTTIRRDVYPMMISGEVMEEISQLLSEQTRGWMNDFIGDNFGMPSEFCDSPRFTPVLM